jgi:hypothetical protein
MASESRTCVEGRHGIGTVGAKYHTSNPAQRESPVKTTGIGIVESDLRLPGFSLRLVNGALRGCSLDSAGSDSALLARHDASMRADVAVRRSTRAGRSHRTVHPRQLTGSAGYAVLLTKSRANLTELDVMRSRMCTLQVGNWPVRLNGRNGGVNVGQRGGS